MGTRKVFTSDEFIATRGTRGELRWGERTGAYVRVAQGAYVDGPAAPTRREVAIGRVLGSERVARGIDAGVLLGLDGMPLRLPDARRFRGPMLAGPPVVAHGVHCANGLQTVVDLASLLDDSHWEMANESALHKQLFTIPNLEALLPVLSDGRVSGVRRIRRVLALRPIGAPPTESALETLMVQLIRTRPTVPTPTRQLVLHDERGVFVARIDLCWPELGLFIELDGEGHAGQPVYDASRESAIVATTGWLCGRFSWTEVRRHPEHTGARLARLVEQALRRPLPVN